MAIKTKTSRDTYRSNVKERPLRQNGLEAQYQGLDISEVNIDHSGLAIIGRGGHQTRRDIRKVRKQYIVDVPQEEHNPTAELVFLQGAATDTPLSPFFMAGQTDPADPATAVGWGISGHSLQLLDGEVFRLVDQDNNDFTFEFTNTEANTNGEAFGASNNIAVNIFENNYSKRELMFAITGSIETVFPEDTFRFQLYSSGSKQEQYGYPEPVTILEDKIVLILSSSVTGSAELEGLSNFLGDTNDFDDQSESHEWRLNGFLKDNSDPRTFYEDLRTDTIQSTEPHSFKSSVTLFRPAQFTGGNPAAASFDPRSNYDRNIGPYEYANTPYSGIAGDPTQQDRFTTHDSSEVLVRQFPKREEIFDTYRGNHQWREDIHYLSPDQQTWSRMEALATNYHSSLTAHIEAMMNSNFADEQYIDPNPLSGRVDALNRLSRIFDTHTNLIFERHQNSVFDQYLDPIDDFRNLQVNRFPKADITNRDAPFEDLKGVLEMEKPVRSATNSTFEYIHTGVANFQSNFRIFLPDETEAFTVFFITGPAHDTTWQGGIMSYTNALRIDSNLVSAPDDVVQLIVAAFEDLRTNPVNGFDFSGYTITEDLTGPNASFTITGLGRRKRIRLSDNSSYNGGPANQITVTEGVDAFSHGDNFVEDYFDQPPLENHDYIEDERWSRIDEEMLDVLTFNANRGTHIDRREWQESDYVYTATGFINSQTSGQDGIIYREMKR